MEIGIYVARACDCVWRSVDVGHGAASPLKPQGHTTCWQAHHEIMPLPLVLVLNPPTIVLHSVSWLAEKALQLYYLANVLYLKTLETSGEYIFNTKYISR